MLLEIISLKQELVCVDEYLRRETGVKGGQVKNVLPVRGKEVNLCINDLSSKGVSLKRESPHYPFHFPIIVKITHRKETRTRSSRPTPRASHPTTTSWLY